MTEQPKLDELRQRLARLGLMRRGVRWFCALSVASAWLILLLLVLMLIDVSFELDILQRVTISALGAAAFGWVILKKVRPHLGRRESEIDLALHIERLHGIDTDLVAAIEFTRPAAENWGSPVFRGKVIEKIVASDRRFDFAAGIDRRELLQKTRNLLVFVALAATVTLLYPQHVSIFLKRLALGGAHYPSRTVIASIEVNGEHVFPADNDHTPRATRSAERGPVEFMVRVSRAAPDEGELRVSLVGGGTAKTMRLKRREAGSDEPSDKATFQARIPALYESIRYQVYLGDAWTNPSVVQLNPLPQIDVSARVTPPTYTGAAQSQRTSEGLRRMTVLEGSKVELFVSSTNGKSLKTVVAKLKSGSDSLQCELEPMDEARVEWRLPVTQDLPLNRVRRTVQFSVEARDMDGLQPTEAPSGEIRIQADALPDVVAATIHRVVLPVARPQLAYRIYDDIAVGRLRLQAQIERKTQPLSDATDDVAPPETRWLDIDTEGFPIARSNLPYQGRYTLDLEPFGLLKGDRIKLTFQATDHRGPADGMSVMSKPLYLEVSDKAGVMAAILEADHRTDNELDEMIRNELGLGESQ